MKIINANNLPQQAVSHNPEITKKVMLSGNDLPHLTNFSQVTFAPGQLRSLIRIEICLKYFLSARVRE